MITHERLFQLVSYNTDTGEFYNLVVRGNLSAGEKIGWVNGKGYINIMLDWTSYPAHRLAWFYMTGRWPTDQIDHRNRIRNDNRWVNLREATNTQNCRNAKLNVRNASGAKGVYWYSRHQKWTAQIRVDGKLLSLGYFTTKEQAISARAEAEEKYFGEFSAAA